MRDRWLFASAGYLSKPVGFYALLVVMALCTLLVPFGWTEVVTYALSVAAIAITGIVLIQGDRDTAAIHAKLDAIILAMNDAGNDVIGIERGSRRQIRKAILELEEQANGEGAGLDD